MMTRVDLPSQPKSFTIFSLLNSSSAAVLASCECRKLCRSGAKVLLVDPASRRDADIGVRD